MKQEDIIILQLIKELLQDKTSPEMVEGILDDNVLKKLHIAHTTSPTQSQELQNLEAQNKLLLERLDSQTSMTELGMKHMMQELSELKEKCADMTSPKNVTGNFDIDEERKALIKERKALEEERSRLESWANQLKTDKKGGQFFATGSSSSLDWQILQSNLLADTQKIQKYLPQSYLFLSSSYQENSFVWIGEKMGLTYTVLVHCEDNTEIQKHTLMILLNTWFNHIILENRFMLDIEQVMKEIYTRLNNLNLSQNYVKLGITSIDYLNSNISFVGLGVDLWKQRNGNIKTVRQEFANFQHKNAIQQIRKQTLQAEQNSSFVMLCVDENQKDFKQNLQKELINNTSDVSWQKQKLEQFLRKFQDFIILGFKA